MALYSLRRTDYKEIIQVSDMDGAFVPDSAIVEDKNAYKPVYSEKEIHTNHPEGIMKRNAQSCRLLKTQQGLLKMLTVYNPIHIVQQLLVTGFTWELCMVH